jgi:RNA polymerase sigma-70 factor (ECF subfamily)
MVIRLRRFPLKTEKTCLNSPKFIEFQFGCSFSSAGTLCHGREKLLPRIGVSFYWYDVLIGTIWPLCRQLKYFVVWLRFRKGVTSRLESIQSSTRFQEFPLATAESTTKQYALRDPDVRLMLQVRDDNAAAFEELMRRYQSRVITIFEHMVGPRQQAEDLAQDVFLRVYRSRKNYQPRAKFSTWLFTIANNVASNALRSLSRRREVHVAPAGSGAMSANPLDEMALAASGWMPARRVDKAEMAEVVRLAMQSLNDRQRMAVLLSKFEGMSYADIAQSMEMSPQAIKSLLSRARGNLRDILQPYLSEGVPPPSVE